MYMYMYAAIQHYTIWCLWPVHVHIHDFEPNLKLDDQRNGRGENQKQNATLQERTWHEKKKRKKEKKKINLKGQKKNASDWEKEENQNRPTTKNRKDE